MKLALIGRSMISPFGLAIRPRMPASWRICLNDPRAPELAIMKIGFSSSRLLLHRLADLVGCRGPLLDDLLVALLLRRSGPCRTGPGSRRPRPRMRSRISSLSGGMTTSFLETVMPALRGELEAEVLERVEHERDRVRAVLVDQLLDHRADVPLAQRLVDELVLGRVAVLARASPRSARSMRSLKMIRPTVVRTCVSARRDGGTRRGRAA